MKNFTRIFTAGVFLFALMQNANSQTNVSGGIYSNTTWTKVNSPYIVTDTVVVFPGVTLTIQPGVVVKFDASIRLEIRQGKLIAIGTVVDSITFTSNSPTPTQGIWGNVFLNNSNVSKFNYCNFRYATRGIYNDQMGSSNDTLIVKNSNFNYNNYGTYNWWIDGTNEFDSCNFINNQTGIYTEYGWTNAVANYCSFSNNQSNGFGTSSMMSGYLKNCVASYNQNYGIQAKTVINCTVQNNQTGIQGARHITNCIVRNNIYGIQNSDTVDNCTVNANQYGVNAQNITNNTVDSNTVMGIRWSGNVTDCNIKYNGTGIYLTDSVYTITKNFIENNTVGIEMAANNNIYCNKICNNTSYDLKYTMTHNYTVSNNYWCTPDSASTTAVIYDGYDNINLGLVNFMPLDTACYLTGCNLSITANIVNATCSTCPNGNATAQVANGFAPYTYTWYTSPIQITQTATGLAPGTYTICVIDANGCTACDSVFVDSTYCLGSISLSTTATNASCGTCNDGSATANVVGGMWPYTYVWSPTSGSTQTIGNLLPGTYSVCVTDGLGCTACSFATVGTGTCSASFNLYPDTILHTYIAVNTAAGAAPLTYSWNWGDGSPASSGPTPSHTYTVAGTYNICLSIIDATGCTNTFCQSYYLLKTTNTMIYVNVISAPTGIDESFDNTSISVFPNPTTGEFTVYGLRSAVQIKVYNMVGEKIYQSLVNSHLSLGNPPMTNAPMTIDISLPSGLGQGIYFLQVKTNNGTAVKKIIKE